MFRKWLTYCSSISAVKYSGIPLMSHFSTTSAVKYSGIPLMSLTEPPTQAVLFLFEQRWNGRLENYELLFLLFFVRCPPLAVLVGGFYLILILFQSKSKTVWPCVIKDTALVPVCYGWRWCNCSLKLPVHLELAEEE